MMWISKKKLERMLSAAEDSAFDRARRDRKMSIDALRYELREQRKEDRERLFALTLVRNSTAGSPPVSAFDISAARVCKALMDYFSLQLQHSPEKIVVAKKGGPEPGE